MNMADYMGYFKIKINIFKLKTEPNRNSGTKKITTHFKIYSIWKLKYNNITQDGRE